MTEAEKIMEDQVHGEDIDFSELKPKPIEKPDMKLRAPEKLEKVETSSKPEVFLTLSDYWNRIVFALKGFLVDSGVQIGKRLIPFWTWIIFALVLALAFYIRTL